MEPWTRQLLAIIVSQICKTIGWHSISTTSLQILVDVLHRYLKRLGTNIHDHAEHLNHTLPTLEEINLAFNEMGINVEDLKEYAEYVSSIPLKIKVPKYPLEKKSNLNFLKQGSREVVTRSLHIHEHLPAMFPELSEDNYGNLETTTDDTLPDLNIETPSTALFKKPESEVINNKRIQQLVSEETGRPMRDISSVLMISSGFLSPSREGKVAEARVPKLSNYTNANPTQPSSYPTVPPEVKGDSKKNNHVTKPVNNGKPERKIRDEIHQNGKEDLDDSKIKKLTTHKEVSKLKPFKSFHNKNIDNDSPKIVRPEKIKPPAPISPKEPKIHKPKVEKIPEKIPEPEMVVEEKLTTEPNKQKLNIFKRISKVKEERAESPIPKPVTVAEKNAQINECIEAVVKRSSEKYEVEKVNHKEEKHKPVVFEEPPPPAAPPVKHLKRKKKQKNEIPAKKRREINHEPEEIVEKQKPKMVEIESDIPLYSLMNDIHKTPGIIPASLSHNPLIPRFTPNPFLPGFGRFESNGPHPEMPNLPLPPASLMQANVDTKVKPSVRNSVVEPEPKFQDEPQPSTSAQADKKLKKKMKKDKREKDKKKTKKDKIKNKERLDKKKELKVLKKIKGKNKNKIKIKKDKKLNVEKQDTTTEDPSVPKLKLKLANPNSPQLSPSGILSPKIVIKPIVKHDELPKTPPRFERDPSPELAKISALSSKSSKKQSKIISELPSTSFSKPVESITISKNDKSFGNIKIKPKNKDKQKNKKTEEKAKPAAFYYDDEGNQVWVCPACGAQDDGSPMIGCDGCDAWYHWVCVGIKSAPESAKWFCETCAKS